ncbi:hypothetical protein [Kitasatospora sp. GP82]|uniref:hypothetical protein n=1 Tax=Kitasatospora sp. GP82 TaxID=3035089 RepID=UPI002474EA4B|nr:hypothetical protein [Kitasatospora sp. GP82]MDH6124513.1 hypothetical protein [Kitasatospora sp. GP82]
MTDAHALAARLDTFWEGDFTLHAAPAGPVTPAGPHGAAPGDTGAELGPAIADLGPSGIRVAGRDLAVLLASAYREMTGSGD